MKTMKERMLHLIDLMIGEVEQICEKDNPEPEEVALIPTLVDSIVQITAYAVIEKKEENN